MTRGQVCAACATASVTCGVLSAWAFVAFGACVAGPVDQLLGAGGVSSVLLLALLGALIGAVVGGVLGVVPTLVVVLAWGLVRDRFGPRRDVDAASVLVAVTVFVELAIVLHRQEGGTTGATIVIGAVVAVLAGGWARVHLGIGRRRIARVMSRPY